MMSCSECRPVAVCLNGDDCPWEERGICLFRHEDSTRCGVRAPTPRGLAEELQLLAVKLASLASAEQELEAPQKKGRVFSFFMDEWRKHFSLERKQGKQMVDVTTDRLLFELGGRGMALTMCCRSPK